MTDPRDAAIQATLAAWRDQGVHRTHPARFCLIEALAGRAQRVDGQARQVLQARLDVLVGEFRQALDANTPPEAQADDAAAAAVSTAPQGAEPAPPGAPQSLCELLGYMQDHPAAAHDGEAAQDRARLRQRYPELDLLDYFQATWARLSTDRQLLQSEEQVHENAGPLNSNHLVHRALSLMRAQSPGYLHQFLAYLDGLGWVDQLVNNGGLAARPAARGKKPGRAAR